VRGGEADAANFAGETPLHRAAIAGDADVARALIEYGARIDARDIEDRTPLQRAVLGNQHVVGARWAGYGAQHEGVG
jgi:ankyrin repeat protein